MSILLTKQTRAIVQGITGKIGAIQARWMLECGTNIVGGVTPGGGGKEVHGVPVYDSVAEAVKKQQANASVLFVPAAYARDAVLEAIDAGIALIVCVPEHIPVHDTVQIRASAQQKGIWLIGPNTPGVLTPGVGKMGIMPANLFEPGRIGLISRSGTLCYEVAGYINEGGYGQSTVIGIGGDMVRGSDVQNVLREFDQDSETDMVVVVGEVGGVMEEQVAECLQHMHKPVITYIAGQTAPAGKKMGHAGAIIQGNEGTVACKQDALRKAGAIVATRIADIPELIARAYK
jgi:succinyl-CoA synthetase alpha subunit